MRIIWVIISGSFLFIFGLSISFIANNRIRQNAKEYDNRRLEEQV